MSGSGGSVDGPGVEGGRGRLFQLLHLVRRFFGAVRPGPPSTEDEQWAYQHLLTGEQEVWRRMSNPDRRHAVAVARATVSELSNRGIAPPPGYRSDRPIIAAALLHDSGKVIGGLRTPGRVIATIFWALADDELADRWVQLPGGGLKSRLGSYRRHPELGATMLAAAGSDPLTSAWAREHHRPPEKWSVPYDIALVLKECDDD